MSHSRSLLATKIRDAAILAALATGTLFTGVAIAAQPAPKAATQQVASVASAAAVSLKPASSHAGVVIQDTIDPEVVHHFPPTVVHHFP